MALFRPSRMALIAAALRAAGLPQGGEAAG
jgi:hypothetical protein